MPGVFISYRREDSAGYAGRLFDILSAHVGRENTYMDLDTIEGGDDFSAVIVEKINLSAAVVAVIGRRWLTMTDDAGKRRLENPRDFVRIEIAKALERGIRVIPVLVGGAAMPQVTDLPDDLKPLCERQALEIRDSSFHPDTQQLIEDLDKALRAGNQPARSNLQRLVFAMVGAAVVVMLVYVVLAFQRPKQAAGAQAPTGSPGATLSPAPLNAGPQTTAVAGKWTATVKYDWGDSYDETFNFETEDAQLSGTAGFLGDRDGDGRVISDGKTAGNRISFTTKSQSTSLHGNVTDTHTYKGIISGDTIAFTMVTESSVTDHAPIHFIAHRVKR